MKTKKIKIFCVILLSAVIFTACSQPDSADISPDDGRNDSTESLAPDSETPGEEIPDIPEEQPDLPETDMEGKNITILSSSYWQWTPKDITDIAPQEYNGDILNDAAYERKLKIEQQFNITITHIDIPAMPDAVRSFQNAVRANDETYDIALIRGAVFDGLLTSGVLLDLAQIPYVDLEKPWWDKKAFDALAIGKTHFGMDGSMSTNKMLAVDILCFNKGMLRDFGLDSPYELVKSGDWTWDTVVSMAREVSFDLNGDGEMTHNADRWGISYTVDTAVSVLNNCGIHLVELDSDGVPVITLNSESAISKLPNIFEMLYDGSYAFDTNRGASSNDAIFSDNRALFFFSSTQDIGSLRSTDVDFGIVPYPKYDKVQADYIPSMLGQSVPLICVPTTNSDLENTGIFMEAFAFEGYKNLVPQFREKVLMGKLARDDESEDMLDYIYGNVTYDVGAIMNLGDLAMKISWMEKDNLNIVSFLERNLNPVQRVIDRIMGAVT